MAEDHIVPGSPKDNFWEMGATGPCGPCSEIHYDHVGDRNAAGLVNKDDITVIEIWNNVFIQYNRENDGSLKLLPAKHVDTGMGFERLVAALNGTLSNYDTDIFTPIFSRIQEITGFGEKDFDGIDTAYRVIADHTRTLTFALSDGGVPSNIGRGYVLRRILRRGPGAGAAFPEITKKYDDIKEMLDEEEKSFARFSREAQSSAGKELNGRDVWRLYDTFGFPVDLTKLMAEELGLKINKQQYEEAQAYSKEISKAAAKKDGKEAIKLDVHDIAALEKDDRVPKTNDGYKFELGDVTATIKAIYHERKFLKSTAELPENAPFGVLLDKTSFYAEAGGQEYDTGSITIDGVAEFAVENVQVFNGYVLHIGKLKYGSLKIGDEVHAEYDELRRWPLRNNHTATHILNFALREILGDHIDQKGSLVAPLKLRFDFSHKSQVTPAELEKIEDVCNKWIQKNVPVYSKELDLQTARKIPGLRAVFGEVYPDPVRVVTLEFDLDEIVKDVTNPKWRGTSVEFCGGTHVKTTGDIKDLLITEETAIAKGIRRIIAITGTEAREASRVALSLESELETIKKKAGKDKDAAMKAFSVTLAAADISLLKKGQLKDRLAAIRKAYDGEVKAAETAISKKAVAELETFFRENPNANLYVSNIIDANANPKILQSVLLKARSLEKSVYLFSADQESSKVAHINFVPKRKISKEFDARIWSSAVTRIIGGKAGGKEDSTQGISTETPKIDEALQVAKSSFPSS
ncbi:tRNA synthetases class II (A)-domain-containing protein [Cantharellus anzutake]|uniref:tRNA synthetases class II (A)-domain-containing protein n=1 Tax=Cantharellus anzutake TaxID=1750568 RepID=UPI001903B106|nr:tRNA synthetases class II (A)-domain-containing protein [Cantharellus anzutake]KAF8342014.1 tRNA synthetases class II (A)-domain-containing protein [Cantharellus anzutake]